MEQFYTVISNAIGASGFVSTDTSAAYVNPSYWNRQVLAFLEEKLLVADKAKVYDDILGQDGASFSVTIDSTPTAAAAVAETADVTVAVQAHTQVIFTPSEYAKAFQLSDKEARRSFVDQMANMTKKIGYSLALARDDAAVSLLQASAGNTVVANNVVASNLASSDTLDYADIVNGAEKLMEDQLVPRYLVVGSKGFAQLAKDTQFSYANQAGGPGTLKEGIIGRIFGLDVVWTTQIGVSSSTAKAIIIGVDQLGEPCFGIGRKALPAIRTERHELGRYTDIVGVEEWDIKLLRANGFCTIQHWAA